MGFTDYMKKHRDPLCMGVSQTGDAPGNPNSYRGKEGPTKG